MSPPRRVQRLLKKRQQKQNKCTLPSLIVEIHSVCISTIKEELKTDYNGLRQTKSSDKITKDVSDTFFRHTKF